MNFVKWCHMICIIAMLWLSSDIFCVFFLVLKCVRNVSVFDSLGQYTPIQVDKGWISFYNWFLQVERVLEWCHNMGFIAIMPGQWVNWLNFCPGLWSGHRFRDFQFFTLRPLYTPQKMTKGEFLSIIASYRLKEF